MKYTLVMLLLLSSTAPEAEEVAKPIPDANTAPARSSESKLNLCPKDMPPACACVEYGNGVRVMPANEAYKSRAKILLVGPQT
ncbi:hypothetical protein [Pelagibius sp. Alg239-R121]|uniref:hypothetical protein n=1 Tax=Pelagibius sp. Alg239-R121 TaxID=2993448 RepID=UPI0024A6FCFF|nr:hypothetical protein [Pelagibius sp. Alg239-R121]